jgi:tRNA threonylcarbamoyladenosine biosynthesis protein TsaE
MSEIILQKNSNSVQETIIIAEEFLKSLSNLDCIFILSGDLGAGKTHFTKGIFKGLGFENYKDITSPTFDLVNTFNLDNIKVHHFDLYRIDKLSSEDEMWLYELLNEKSLCIIEWGDKFEFYINKKIYEIQINLKGENEREIKIFTN